MTTMARRVWNGVARRALRVRFGIRNRVSRSPVTGDGPIVSLTTHGPRLGSAHLAVESIGRGSLRPARIVLWLAPEDHARPLPPTLRRLVARGLEVREAGDFGPHTKYWPLIASRPERDFATADDDVFYPRGWLAELRRAADRLPGAIVCFRARVVRFDDTGPPPRILPYTSWTPCRSTVPSTLHFATGVSGVLYPRSFADVVREAGTVFLERAPRADDVWLHCLAVRAGLRIAQVRPRPAEFLGVPGTRPTGLYRANESGGNDRQIAQTYAADVLALLAATSRGATGVI
ncbi:MULTISPECIES: hypothetical protein [unclassified Microbacterium]|uniref:hypothetical protein n=1 Tax=unclassified Microbacterium TaxID=2609290 RepID=UPI00214B91AF|nr:MULTISPECIES: hypothetical protein [unclassified Microbacterium]MCR2784786.1 hypothetical protein [Microbacterium sp. zg.B96]WIM16325.1 hypothetical protein QNO11_01455 [Microbacterium sp. zg-B96]